MWPNLLNVCLYCELIVWPFLLSLIKLIGQLAGSHRLCTIISGEPLKHVVCCVIVSWGGYKLSPSDLNVLALS